MKDKLFRLRYEDKYCGRIESWLWATGMNDPEIRWQLEHGWRLVSLELEEKADYTQNVYTTIPRSSKSRRLREDEDLEKVLRNWRATKK